MKVLIVDDEAVIRIGLKSIINWEANDFELIGEASDGKKALQLTREQQPDITITDIKMPVMDGLEYIRQIQSLPKKPRVVVLSSYNDFELVKGAMKLGAEDYLLKLNMEPDDLLHVLENIRCKIDECRVQEDSTQFLNEQVQKNIPILRRNLLKDILKHSDNQHQELLATLNFLNIRLNMDHLFCLAVKIGALYRFEDMMEEELAALNSSIINIIEEIIGDDFHGNCFQGKTGQFYVLLSPKIDYTDGQLRDRLISTSRRLIEILKQYVNITAAIGVSGEHSGLTGIWEAYHQAVAAVGYRFFKGKEQVVFWDEVSSFQTSNQSYVISGLKERIWKALSLRQEAEVAQIFTSIQQDSAKLSLSREQAGNLALELLFTIYEFFERFQIVAKDVLVLSFRTPQQLIYLESYSQLQEWIGLLKEDLIGYLKKEQATDYPRIITKAKKYIEEHYNQEISLKEVAKTLNLNPSYFSTIFKQYTGISYTDYLTNVRINLGKDLLRDTEYKVYEISKMLGYQNDYYFNRIFKKLTGITPLEYKNSLKE